MNTSPRRVVRLLTLIVALSVAGSVVGQPSKPNPLRQASHTADVGTGIPKEAVPKTAPKAKKTRDVTKPSPVRPTGLQLARHTRTNFSPPHEALTETVIIGGELAQPIQGEIIYEDGIHGGIVQGDCCGGKGCSNCFSIPCPTFCLDNFEFSAGVHGVTGPVNRGETGSFGFHEGFNWGAPVPCFGGALGGQIGLNAVHSNFSGAEFTDEHRHQFFLTGGLFRRVDWGLQGGIVVDYLADDWYADYDILQIRSEVSWVFPCVHELGFWLTASLDEDPETFLLTGSTNSVTETFEGTDLYAFFYRFHASDFEGAQARFFAGFTGDSDGLIGGDIRLPVSCDWAVEGGFAYLIPEEATGTAGRGHAEESWNVSLGIVWYPGARTAYGNDYCRPLFNVADNGSFMVGRR
jgi:hypothetical protein